MTESLFRDLSRRRFWSRFATQALSALGAIAVVAGLIDIFLPLLLAPIPWGVWPSLGASILYGLIRAWPRPIETSFEAPRTKIRLVRGDLFSQDGHLVIGAPDTFDVAPPHIAPDSVQGQLLSRVFEGDVEALDAAIGEALPKSAVPAPILEKLGKASRYPLGTVVTLKRPMRSYFLVAYSTMDSRSTASSSSDIMWNSLSSLWKEVRAESNGRRVNIPMIGGGQSKLSPILPAQDAVRFIALSFMLASRSSKVCDELVIVALPGEYEKLDHMELQAFFDSLRPT